MQHIIDAITAKLGEIPGLNYASENWGQLMYFGKDMPVQWPCALADITGGQFSDIGSDWRQSPENRQEATVNIEITVANLRLTNTSARAAFSKGGGILYLGFGGGGSQGPARLETGRKFRGADPPEREG